MYSYNNIISKEEPANKFLLERVFVDGDTGNLLPRHDERHPSLTTSWRSASSSESVPFPTDDDVIVIDDLLSREECEKLVHTTETIGFTFWKNPSADASSERAAQEKEEEAVPEDAKAFRTAFTVEVHLEKVAAAIWNRLDALALPQLRQRVFAPDMPDADRMFERDMIGVWEPVGICDNLLFARYRNGGHFAPHVDGTNILDLNTRTLFTVLIYLNDCAEGGETFVLQGEQCEALVQGDEGKWVGSVASRVGAVRPTTGRAAIFYHNVLHEGSPVVVGHEKYILRADVLYRRVPPILTSEKDVAAFQAYQDARVLEANGDALSAVRKFQLVKKLSSGVADLYQL